MSLVRVTIDLPKGHSVWRVIAAPSEDGDFRYSKGFPLECKILGVSVLPRRKRVKRKVHRR